MRSRAAILCCLLWGCSGDGYRVLVHVPGGASRARRVEVSVIESCGELARLGDPPPAPTLQVEVLEGAAPRLGAVPAGSYGLYGRAWDGGCMLFASACDTFAVEAGGAGTVEITLSPIPVLGCAGDETCRTESVRCVPADAGPDAARDSGIDAGAASDAAPDDAHVSDAAPDDAHVSDAAPDDAHVSDAAPDDAHVSDAAPPDGGGAPPCDEIFGELDGYELCHEFDWTCEFFVQSWGNSCDDVCASVGQYCQDASDADDGCDDRPDPVTCSTSREEQICVCSRR